MCRYPAPPPNPWVKGVLQLGGEGYSHATGIFPGKIGPVLSHYARASAPPGRGCKPQAQITHTKRASDSGGVRIGHNPKENTATVT